MIKMIIGIGSDHGGFKYKKLIKDYLAAQGHEVRDFGTLTEEPVDYPMIIRPEAEAVSKGECDRGIVIGGSGNGGAIVANRVLGVRCAVCWNLESARTARAHENSNMLSLGENLLSESEALAIVDIWLTTPFDGGRHERRIEEIDAEKKPVVY